MGCRMTRQSRAAALVFLLALSTLPALASTGERAAPLREAPGLLSVLWDAVLDLWEGLLPLTAQDETDQGLGMDTEPSNSGDLGPGLDPAG